MSVTITQLQAEIRDRLAADSYFANITVVSLIDKDLDNSIARALGAVTDKAAKIGIFAIVGTLIVDVGSADIPGPYFDPLRLSVTIYEDPTLNHSADGTGKRTFDACVRAAQVLHGYLPDGLARTIVCDKAAIRPALPPEGADNLDGNRVAILIPADIQADPRVATPSISPADAASPVTLTLACATAGAAIYYTLDESYPSALNPNAVLYAAPFQVATPGALRAVAHKTGMIASDSALGVYT